MKEYLHFFKYYKENQQVQCLTRAELQDFQLKKFRRLVKHALTISPFYRDFYAEAGISIHDVATITPQDCPITNKQMLMENFNQIVSDSHLTYEKLNRFAAESHDCRELYQNKYLIIHTSGSTGFSAIFPYSLDEYLFIKIQSLEHVLRSTPLEALTQIFKRKKMVFYGATDGHYAGVTMVASSPNLLYDTRLISFLEPLEKVVRELNNFQPEIITGYASTISQLAEAQLKGRLKIKPESICCSGDAMYPAFRELIKKAFGINPMNIYSSTEAPLLAWQANDHSEDMYVADHLYHVDLVDNKVCQSNLYLYTFPLIRYQMEDSIEFQSRDDRNPFSKIRLKNARTLDAIEVVDNQGEKVILPSMAFVLIHIDGLEQFQFWKKADNTILVKAKGKGDHLSERLKAEVMHILHERNADKAVHIEIELVDNIPVDSKTGKFKLINTV